MWFLLLFRILSLFYNKHVQIEMNKLFWGVPGGSVVKNPPANAGDLGLIPGSGRVPGEGSSHSSKYSCLESPIHKGAQRTAIHGVTKELDMT